VAGGPDGVVARPLDAARRRRSMRPPLNVDLEV
jgi:hypothetical protein